MPARFDMMKQNKDTLQIKCLVIVCDKTLQVTYSLHTNLHLEWGISKDEMYSSLHTRSQRKYKKALYEIRQATGRKFKLTGTDNGLGYTRLIYTLQGGK